VEIARNICVKITTTEFTPHHNTTLTEAKNYIRISSTNWSQIPLQRAGWPQPITH